ncbi:MAG: LCP family protein [Candidatus Limnocylindria bacterium]
MVTWGKVRGSRVAWFGIAGTTLLAALVAGWLLASRNSTEPVAAAPSPTAELTASPTRTPGPTPTPSPTDPPPTPAPSPTASPEPAALDDGRLNVLVLGTDSDAGRRARGMGYLTDAITLLSVAADGSDVALFSLPRDSSDIPMPDGTVWTGKVNAITPTLGPATMRDAMSLLIGVPIDHYVMIDMDDFRRIVDAIGGVTVDVPYALADNRCVIGAGTQYLDGALALCFARHRAVDSDYARAGRHQQLLLAIRDRLAAGGVDIAALTGALGSLQTDIGASEIPILLDLAARAQTATVQRLVLDPPEFTSFAGIAGARGWISVPNGGAIRAAVAAMLPGPESLVGAPGAEDSEERPPSDAQIE